MFSQWKDRQRKIELTPVLPLIAIGSAGVFLAKNL
jgi:hypothetical protein